MSEEKIVFCGNNEKFLTSKLTKKSDEHNGGTAFRIPSIVNANGTLVAAIDKASSGADWGYIEIAIRRSEDGGKTWDDIKSILTPPARESKIGDENYSSAFFIDPCMTVAKNGDIIMAIDFFPECKGIHNKKLLDDKKPFFTSIDGKLYQLIYDRDGNYYTVRENGEVFDSNGEKTTFTLKQDIGGTYNEIGALFNKDEYVGNIYLNGAVGKKEIETELTYGAKLKAPKRCYTFITKSSDKGTTWSKPVDISASIYNENDGTFFGVAPGAGLTLECGRIIMPLYSQKGSAAIYSDDNGATWKRTTFCPYIFANGEWQAFEKDSKIYAFARQNRKGKTPVSISTDNGSTWTKAKKTNLISSKCQKSVIIVGDKILCSHPTGKKRENGVISVGTICENKNGKFKGIEWSKNDININNGFFAYSCLTDLGNGKIGVLYEDEPSSYILFKTFDMKDFN